MRMSEEKVQELMAKVRQILVMKPEATGKEVADAIGVERRYALRLMKKVRRENAERINRQTIEGELGKMEAEISEICLILWQIITKSTKTILDKDGKVVTIDMPDNEKINAIKALLEAKRILFNAKFDAGIFSRQLGTLKTENKSIIISLLLKNAKPEFKEQYAEFWKMVHRAGRDRMYRGTLQNRPTSDDRIRSLRSVAKGSETTLENGIAS